MAQRRILLGPLAASHYGAQLREVAPGYEPLSVEDPDLAAHLDDIEIAFFSWDCYPDHAREFMIAALKSPALRWLHSMSAGVDDPVFRTFVERGVTLTTSSGAHAVAIAQTVILYLLALSRDLPGWLEAKADHRWDEREIVDLQGQTLGVLGLGPIGLEIARLGLGLRMNVIGMRRRPNGDEPCETWPMERIDELVGRVDHLVLALPLTSETRNVISGMRLARMKVGACLYNVGRGALVDETALAEALRSGRLAGAGLDVFEAEPLPGDSPLWDLDNVILSPHCSGKTPSNFHRVTEIFLDNLARYLTDEPLRNRVTTSQLDES